jgi:hypothetical protein
MMQALAANPPLPLPQSSALPLVMAGWSHPMSGMAAYPARGEAASNAQSSVSKTDRRTIRASIRRDAVFVGNYFAEVMM